MKKELEDKANKLSELKFGEQYLPHKISKCYKLIFKEMISHIDKIIVQNEKDRRELSMRITELEKKSYKNDDLGLWEHIKIINKLMEFDFEDEKELLHANGVVDQEIHLILDALNFKREE